MEPGRFVASPLKMQRLRTTFKRSRTPTGAEMKTQSSLEVPKQIRSASFDEIQLEAKRQQAQGQLSTPDALLKVTRPFFNLRFVVLKLSISHLQVPQFPSQRSRSVDSGGSDESGTYLEVPSRRFPRRRSSGSKSPVCVHCLCVEEYNRLHPPEEPQPIGKDELLPPLSMSDSSSECDDEPVPECAITVTLSPTVPSPPIQSPPPIPIQSPVIEYFSAEEPCPPPASPSRRKSIQRQEAFFAEPTGTSLENMSDGPSELFSDATSEGALSEGDAVNTTIPGLVVRDIYLQVPDLKRDRAASVDSCFSKMSQGKTEELQHSGVSLEVPVGPNVALRSRSVDIVLPTDEQARYKALAMAAPAGSALYNRYVLPTETTSMQLSYLLSYYQCYF